MFRRPPATLLLTLATVLGPGCQSPTPPEAALRLDAGEYARAFTTAEDVARRYGLPPALRDRRSGLLQTEFSSAASVLEPIDQTSADADERMAGTLAHLRRRARFEFHPSNAPLHAASPEELAAPPDLLGLAEEGVDLTTWRGPIELRVWVDVQRSNLVGLRRDTWTRAATSRTVVVPPEGQRVDRSYWVPVARDQALEARMVREIESVLAAHRETPVSVSTAPH